MLGIMSFAGSVIKAIKIFISFWLISRAAASREAKLNLIGRPATQSSTAGTDYASFAIDGNYNSHLRRRSCAHTNDPPGGGNWWRVDLGQPFRLQGVMLVNRGDCCGSRLDNFIVGVSNSSATPVRGQYSVCGQYPGPAATGSNLSIQCNSRIASGRYVIVQQAIYGDGFLTICEVEIYTRGLRNYGSLNRWERLSNHRLISVGATVLSIRSAMMCVGKCQETHDCDSVNYRQSEKTCELNFLPYGGHMTIEKGWDNWAQMCDE